MTWRGWGGVTVACALLCLAVPAARAGERVTLANGFEVDCVRREPAGEPLGSKTRLYFSSAADAGYVDVAAASVVRVEIVPEAVKATADSSAALRNDNKGTGVGQVAAYVQPTVAELREMLAKAGAQHHIDADLLASLVRAESNGQVRALSRTGARGLMQLMPGTASALGVKDAFVADQNVEGGTKYLDELLTRYHDNIALALAAYNAGPGAVDRYHGIPPFRETRAYVTRVIREFNRRKTMLVAAAR